MNFLSARSVTIKAACALLFILSYVSSAFAQPAQKAGPAPKFGMKAYGPDTFPLIVTDVTNKMPVGCGSLGRELIRQALLVCARDEFGLKTLDGAIGEIVNEAKSPAAYPFQLNIRFEEVPNDQDHFLVAVELARWTSKKNWSVSELKPFTIPAANRYEALAEKAEELSRYEYVDLLQSFGFKKIDRDTRSETPTQVTEGHFDSVSQFAYLKQLHRERKKLGDAKENLAGLIRGYANLGSLIDYHWGTSSKAYFARSLIYANRLIALHGTTPYTYGHRAYARAIVGTHLTAIDDINLASNGQGDAAPDWLPLIKAFCEYEPETLDMAKESQQKLALYLRMRQMDPHFDADAGMGIIEDFMRVNPACLRCMELMCEIGGVSLLRQVTEGGADRIWPYVYKRLAEISILPSSSLTLAKKLAGSAEKMPVEAEHRARGEMIGELQRAKEDGSELSWRALAELLDDASLMQAWRKVQCEKYMLAVPCDETIKELKPLLRKHPLESIIRTYSSDTKEANKAIEQLRNAGDAVAIEMPILDFAYHIYRVDSMFYRVFISQNRRHVDDIYTDLIRAGCSSNPELNRTATEKLLKTCPYQPRVVGWSISDTPNLSRARAEEFETRYGKNAYVMYALGKKLVDEGKHWALGERCLRKSIKISPTNSAVSALANEYRDRGDLERAIETYEKVLELPDYGLEHAVANEEIAKLLMGEGKWEEANKYALASAQSYSGRGLLVAAHCAEGLGDWEGAEEFYKAISERYESSSDQWLYFCVRRNRGDREAAIAHCREWWKGDSTEYREQKLWTKAIVALVEGKPKEARKLLIDKNLVGGQDIYTRLVASVISDKAGDAEGRSDCYEHIENSQSASGTVSNLVSLFRSALNKEPIDWQQKSFDEVIATSTSQNDITFAYYCAGMFLTQHGNPTLGKEYLMLAATSFKMDSYGSILAGHELAKQNITVEKTRQSARPESWVPAHKEVTKAGWAVAEQRFDDAAENYKAAMRLRPEFLLPKAQLAILRYNQGEGAEAVKLLEEIATNNPEYEMAHYWLTEIYAGSYKDELRDGKKALQHAQTAFDRRVVKTWFNYTSLAAAHAECKQFDKSIPLMEKANQLYPHSEYLKQILADYKEGKPYRTTLALKVVDETDNEDE